MFLECAFAAGLTLFLGKTFYDSYKNDPEGTMQRLNNQIEKAKERKEKEEARKAGNNR